MKVILDVLDAEEVVIKILGDKRDVKLVQLVNMKVELDRPVVKVREKKRSNRSIEEKSVRPFFVFFCFYVY